MTWVGLGSQLNCSACQKTFEVDKNTPRAVVLMRARAKSWHCYEGYNQGGGAIAVHLCPDCVGTNRSKLPAPPPRLDADEPLF